MSQVIPNRASSTSEYSSGGEESGVTVKVSPPKEVVVALKCCDQKSAEQLMAKFQVENNLPSSVWNSLSMQSLMQPYIDGVGVSVSAEPVNSFVVEKYERVTEMIANRLRNRMFSVKFDVAKRKKSAVLAVSAQFVDPETFRFEIITLGVLLLDEFPSGKQLKKRVEKCIADYGVSPLQVYSSTTDDGRNASLDFLELWEIDNEDCDDEMEMSYPFDGYDPHRASGFTSAAESVQNAVNEFLKPYKKAIADVKEFIRAARPIIVRKDLPEPSKSNSMR